MSQLKAPQPLTRGLPSPVASMRYNWRTFRSNPLGEIAGSLGDLGTLLPLLTAMAAAGTIDPTSTFIFSGLWNITSGVVFGIPIVVQPMKAIAGISVSRPLSLHQSMGAGISVSAIVLLLSVTGLLATFGRIIPIPLVKGIQMGAGLSLVLNAGTQLMKMHWTSHSADNYLVVLVCWILLCFTTRYRRFPYALLLFVIGLAVAAGYGHLPHPGLNRIHWNPPRWREVQDGFWYAGLGQLPLTTLNSIIAVTYLSADLLPERPAPSITSLGVSVATMNLVGCWFGAMPVCHGSGGLSGQIRFGAQSGASVIFLGLIKVIIGVLFGSTVSKLLVNFPKSFLAVMIFAAGVELAKVGEDLNSTARDLWSKATTDPDHDGIMVKRELTERERKERFTVMLVTLAGVIAARNDAVGLLAGTICLLGYKAQDYAENQNWTSWRFRSRSWRFWRQNRNSEHEPLLH